MNTFVLGQYLFLADQLEICHKNDRVRVHLLNSMKNASLDKQKVEQMRGLCN